MGIEMEGANRKANLTDTEGNIKKEPFVLETDVNVMQKTVLLENEIAVKKEPELSDKMKSESSPVETGRTMKIEPGTGPFEDSSSADHLHDNMSIKFEPAEKELFKQKLVIKWKHKPSKKSRSLSLKGRNLQDKHKPNGMPDTLSDNGNFMRIKCEPMADENAYLTREPEHFTVSEIEVNQHCLSPEMITKQKRISHLCSHCQQHFCSRSSLKRHYKRKHSSEGLSFSCKECDAVFTRLIQFRAHERKHRGGDKTFPCQECDVIFTRACHLKVHMRKHTDERPFTCEDCGATFRSTSNLNRHKMKHSGLRPYICTVCNANFYQSSHLVSHVRKHTGERPFTCVECSATFSQLTHLHRHKAKHTGRKPYLCCECGSGFVENCALKRHMLIHNKRMEANHARKRQRRVVGKVANRNLT